MSLEDDLALIEAYCGVRPAHAYCAWLAALAGTTQIPRDDGACFYAADEVVERNDCYQTRIYCPGFITIGDDGGGRAFVIAPDLQPPTVYLVDHGSLDPANFERVADDFRDWSAAAVRSA